VDEITAERLDYSKPPPKYTAAGSMWSHPHRTERGGFVDARPVAMYAAGEAAALAAAWAHYKAEHDPPGFLITGDEEADAGGPGCAAWLLPDGLAAVGSAVGYHDGYTATADARAAAWAWHDRRHALAGQIVTVLEYGDDFDDDGERKVGRRVETTPARLIDVVGPMVVVDFDKTSERDHMHVAAVVADLVSRGRADFEGDAPIDMVHFGAWPRCLTWSDEQVAEVERWLADSTAEMPEVLDV
jgi:hypothetical protein